MKKSIAIILASLPGALILAQQSSNGFLLAGTVLYEQTTQLDIQLEGDAAQIAQALPKERMSEKILHFTEEETLFENYQTGDSEEVTDMDGGGTMMIKMVEPDDKLYTDLENNTRIEQKEFMSRMFLIESECEMSSWKIKGDQKILLEYPCQLAVKEEDGKSVQAWFTPKISVPAGPGKYGNLPGLVLAVVSEAKERQESHRGRVSSPGGRENEGDG